MTNNYLNSIISELKNYPQNNAEILHLIQTKKNAFNRFKREFIKDLENIKNIENEDLIAFAFLVCARNTDVDFHKILSKHFDLNAINTSLAIFAKGIHGSRSGQNVVAYKLLWQSFKENSAYFYPLDFVVLLNLANEFNYQSQQKIITDYLIKKFPTNLDFRLQFLQCFVDNNLSNNEEFKQQFDYVLNNITASAHWCNLARICFDIGDLDNFFKCNEKAFTAEDFPSTGYLFINNIKEGNFPASECLNHMNNLLDFLEENNIKAFLDGGSLLGLYRDGKLMDYDKDTDIGIIVNNNEEVLKILNIIATNKNFICPKSTQFNLKRKILNTTISNVKNGYLTDIFFYHKQGDFLYEGLNTKTADLFWKYTAFDLVKTSFNNFNNKKYYAPKNIELYLEELFGKTWRQHISAWDSLVNCPNITADSKLVVYFYGSIRMHEALRQKKYAKAKNYYDQLKNRWQYPFTTKMCEKIENYLEKLKIINNNK